MERGNVFQVEEQGTLWNAEDRKALSGCELGANGSAGAQRHHWVHSWLLVMSLGAQYLRKANSYPGSPSFGCNSYEAPRHTPPPLYSAPCVLNCVDNSTFFGFSNIFSSSSQDISHNRICLAQNKQHSAGYFLFLAMASMLFFCCCC